MYGQRVMRRLAVATQLALILVLNVFEMTCADRKLAAYLLEQPRVITDLRLLPPLEVDFWQETKTLSELTSDVGKVPIERCRCQVCGAYDYIEITAGHVRFILMKRNK